MSWIPTQASADMLALQVNADAAGRALACMFSSSDEYEEAVIRAKREAGRYGPKQYWRYAVVASAAVGMLAFILQLH